MTRDAFAVDFELVLSPGADPRAPGAEVTVSLCGHWEHDGPCRWPHNTSVEPASVHEPTVPARMRTVVVASVEDRAEVEGRIEAALRSDDRWSVIRLDVGAIRNDEQALADRLARAAADPPVD